MAEILENRANISYSYNGSDVPRGAASNTTSTLLVDPCSVRVTKIPLSTTYKNGDTVSYIVRIENTGSAALNQITVVDNLGADTNPKPLTYVAGSLNVYVNGDPITVTPTTDATLSFTLPSSLSPGTEIIAVYSASTDAQTASITNTVTVTGTGENPAVCTVEQSASATVTATAYANLSIYKSASENTITAGDELTYTFTIMNNGNAEATNVVLTDTLPAVFTVETVSVTTGTQTRVYDPSEYTIDATTNTITLPSTTGTAITVPAATAEGPGIVTVTIVGRVVL